MAIDNERDYSAAEVVLGVDAWVGRQWPCSGYQAECVVTVRSWLAVKGPLHHRSLGHHIPSPLVVSGSQSRQIPSRCDHMQWCGFDGVFHATVLD